MTEQRPEQTGRVHAGQPRDGGFRLPLPDPLGGKERLRGTKIEVGAFWSWAFSDLASNITRSILAEFLVARALGDTRPLRTEWADVDVLTPDGVRVEVKSAAYLQTWRQWKPSAIRFGRFTGRSWDADTGELDEERSVRADVFVFAVQSCQVIADYDRLDVGQWGFYAVPAADVAARGYRSANLAWVRRNAGSAVGYEDLRGAVDRAAALNRESHDGVA